MFKISTGNLLNGVLSGLMKKGASEVAGKLSEILIKEGSSVALDWVQTKLGIDPAEINHDGDIENHMNSSLVNGAITEMDVELGKIRAELEIKKLESEVKIKNIDAKLEKLEFDDVKDARDRTEHQRDTGDGFFERNVTHILTFLVVILNFVALYLLLFTDLPEESRKLGNAYAGLIGGWQAMVLSHYYVHTRSSGEKTKLLSKK